MILTKELHEQIKTDIEKLPFVMWDRLTQSGALITIFGWIDREDFYKDFVCLQYHGIEFKVTTSSKKYSEEISKLLECSHSDCERVETYFKIPNVIKINTIKGIPALFG